MVSFNPGWLITRKTVPYLFSGALCLVLWLEGRNFGVCIGMVNDELAVQFGILSTKSVLSIRSRKAKVNVGRVEQSQEYFQMNLKFWPKMWRRSTGTPRTGFISGRFISNSWTFALQWLAKFSVRVQFLSYSKRCMSTEMFIGWCSLFWELYWMRNCALQLQLTFL